MEKLVRPHISPEKNQKKMQKDAILKAIFRIAAIISGGAIAVIVVFVFMRGVQPFLPGYANGQVNFLDFLFGTLWRQDQGIYGVGFIVINTLITSFGALIISFPISVLTALFIVKIAPKWLAKIMTAIVEMLASIPSVVYGFFGLVAVVPLVRDVFDLPVGETALAGSLILAIMALPTIITVAEDTIRTTPRAMRESSLALGATHWQTIRRVVLPYSASGIAAAAVLGIGRAVGETMAVLMVTGNAAVVPHSLLEPVRTIPATIAAELGEAPAGGAHYEALFMLGCILFLLTLLLSIAVEMISARRPKTM